MKISQLFARKTNPSQQPRCCHKRNDGTECKAHPRTGRQYCFLHDPASQKKSAAARRAGGIIRGYKAQEVLKLPPNLPALPLRDTSEVVEMFRETVNHFRQGEMDLRSANCIRNFGLAMLRVFELDERKAARSAAPRTLAGKKLPLPVRVTIKDILTGELYQSPDWNDHSAAQPPSPGQPDTKPDPKENKPDQNRQPSRSPASAASAKDQTKAQPPANAQHQNEQNGPEQNHQNEPQPNGQHGSPQRYERILHGHSPFPPFITPNQPEKAPEKSPQQNGPSPGPRYIRTF